MDKPVLKARADMLFEVSWEVCNKVGGIYTVVKSKVELMQSSYENYFLVGPYFADKAKLETQQLVPPPQLKKVFDRLAKEGIVCYFGKWIMKGEPRVILVNPQGLIARKNDIKKDLWDWYQIDSLNSHWDFEEPMVWSTAVARMLQYVSEEYKDKKIVGHFHEWLAGVAILQLRHAKARVRTVFTTHATMLGRALAGSGRDLYAILDTMDPQKEAYLSNVQDKFMTERACAHNADVFTTVSEITSIEAEKILGKKADVLLLNGLDAEKFPSFEECSIKHKQYRDVIRDFLATFFFPHYTFDLTQTINLFIVGRYEFKNKGIDIYIRALGKLNERLKKAGSKKTVAAFFWIPAGVNGIKSEILESEEKFSQMRELIDRNMGDIQNRFLILSLQKQALKKEALFDKEFLQEIRQHVLTFARQGTPLLTTHNLSNEKDDPIINGFRQAGLLNRREDVVKAIYYPVYLDENDSLLGLKYYDAIQGCHLGVFPSYYEPWGYTPLESAAFGVPALTTDLSGFGRFIEKRSDKAKGGIFVLHRYSKSDEESTNELAEILFSFVQLSHQDRVEQKMYAKELSRTADWKALAENYIQAHNLAVER
jgi:glycogen synthase